MKYGTKINHKITMLVIIFNSIMLVVFSLVFYSFEDSFQQNRMEAVKELLDVIAAQKKMDLANELFSQQDKAIAHTLNEISSIRNIIAVEILDEKHRVIASSGLSFSAALNEQIGHLNLAFSQFIHWTHLDKSLASYINRIEVNQEIFGILLIHYDLSRIETQIFYLRISRFIVLLLIILMNAYLLRRILHRDVIQPIHLLRDSMCRVCHGENRQHSVMLEVPESANYAHEMFEIINLFDAMTAELAQQHEQLFRQNQQLEQEARLRKENQKLVIKIREQVETKERRQISARLHDGVGQNLQALKLGLQFLKSQMPQSEQQQMVEQLVAETGDTIQQVRNISCDIRPAYLDRLNLMDAVRALCARIAERSTIQFRLKLPDSDFFLTKEKKENLFLVIQEFINNTLKHAQAEEIQVTFTQHNNELQVWVNDNGLGFAATTQAYSESSLGISLMAERMHSIKGHFQHDSAPGEGTSMYLSVGLDENLDRNLDVNVIDNSNPMNTR